MNIAKTLVPLARLCLAVFASAPAARADAERPAVRLDPKQLTSYIGQYDLGGDALITIRREKAGLTIQVVGQLEVPLEALSETDFVVATTDMSVTFVKAKEGKVKKLVLHLQDDREATKVSEEVPAGSATELKAPAAVKVDSKVLDRFVGQYELDTGQVMLIRRDGDRLWTQIESQPNIQVFPASETKFFFRLLDAQLTFVNGKDGNVTQVILHQNGDHEGRKVSSKVPKLELRVGKKRLVGPSDAPAAEDGKK